MEFLVIICVWFINGKSSCVLVVVASLCSVRSGFARLRRSREVWGSACGGSEGSHGCGRQCVWEAAVASRVGSWPGTRPFLSLFFVAKHAKVGQMCGSMENV